jgi:hypothetical protein
MSPVPFDLITATTFTVYAALLYFGGSWLCRNEDDSFQNLGLMFISIPFLAGYIGTSNDSYLAGSVVCGMASLTLTTLLGNLSLKTCLILAVATPLIFCLSTWLLQAI